MKKIALLLALVLMTATSAFAAEGKITNVGDGKITVEMSEDAKLKKGVKVKVNGKAGKVTGVEGNKISIDSNKAAELKAGESVKVIKVNESQGC